MRAPISLTVEAARAAVEDAGLTLDDIDGLSTYPGGMLMGTGISEGGIPALEEALGIKPVWHNGGLETSGQTGSVVAAMLAVASGLCRHVLCFRTVWESTHTDMLRSGTLPLPSGGPLTGEMQWRLPFGAASASNWIAMFASQYLAKYGATRETLGWIALNGRANAARNPAALYRDPMTMDDYLSARPITSPFGLYDCDVPCDGAVAIIVSAAETAGDLRQRPVLVEAVGTAVGERQSWDQGTVTHLPNVFGPAAHLWSRTDLRQADVDVAEIYDGFSFNCLSWLEALGFCGVGEAADFLDGGHRIALDGELPVNTHGGQLSAGRTHGYGFVHEAVVQLRGDGGERQVAGAEVALVAVGGGVPAGAFLLRRG
jgi:acetyl-CoA acetyltransferase